MEYTWKKQGKLSVWKGAVAGAVGGLVASWAMNEFSSLMKTVAESRANGHKQKANGNSEQQQEDPTVTTAEKISESVADIKLNKQQKQKGGAVVHYAFGAVMGAVYGAAAEVAPTVKALVGLPYGVSLFVAADEIVLPVLGLSKKPTQYPLSKHLSGLGQHLVYGATVELVRRGMRERF